MKADIHPDYQETDIVCACGAVYHTRSTKRDIKIGICAACHPFFTGEQKFVDTAGGGGEIRPPRGGGKTDRGPAAAGGAGWRGRRVERPSVGGGAGTGRAAGPVVGGGPRG